MLRPQQRQRRNSSGHVTIDFENNIAAHPAVPINLENAQSFQSEKDLAKLAAEWPSSRLVEVWNSFAGIEFANRKSAVARIWAAIQRLSSDGAQPRRGVAPETARIKKSAVKTAKRARARDITRRGEERSNKRAEVIELMKKPKGATLSEIVETTGWQKAHRPRVHGSIDGNLRSSESSGLGVERTATSATCR
jgi:Protein of unknown function (DUF3489)